MDEDQAGQPHGTQMEHHDPIDLSAAPEPGGAVEPWNAEEPAEAEEEPAAKAKRGNVKPVLTGLASLVVVAGIAFGALFFLKLGPFKPPPPPPVVTMPMPGPHKAGGRGAMMAKGPGGKNQPGKPGGPAKPGAPAKPPKREVAKAPPRMAPAPPTKPAAGQMSSVIGLGAPHARPDPFTPYRNLALLAPAAASIPVLPPVGPMGSSTTDSSTTTGGAGLPPPPSSPPPATTPWHVAGIMTGDGIRAIVMNGDQSAVVQPGDTLPDSSATVTQITDTTVTLRTTGANPTDIPLAVTSGTDTSQGATNNPQGGNRPAGGIQ